MKKISKKLLSVLTALAMIFTIFATPAGEIIGFVGEGVKASAASITKADALTKIAELKALFPSGSYFSVNGKACSHASLKTCSNCTLENILKSNTKASNTVVPSIKPRGGCYTCVAFARFAYCYIWGHDSNTNKKTEINSVDNGGICDAYFEKLVPGDYIWCTKSDGGGHAAIYLGCDTTNNKFYIYSSNWGSPNIVAYNSSISYSYYSKINAVRSNNYVESLNLSSAPNNLGNTFTAPIKVTSTGKVLTAGSDGNVTIADWTNDDSQKWTFTKNSSDNYYEIKNIEYDKNLDVSNGGNVNDTNIQIWEDNDTSSQRFGIYGSQGNYVIKPKYSTTHVVDSGGGNNNVHLWQYYSPTINNQKFTIEADPNPTFSNIKVSSITRDNAVISATAHKKPSTTALKFKITVWPKDSGLFGFLFSDSKQSFAFNSTKPNQGKTTNSIEFNLKGEKTICEGKLMTLKPDTEYYYCITSYYNEGGVTVSYSSGYLTFKTSASCATHSFGSWTVKTNATCTADGLKTRSCTNSGCGKVESATITKLGHSYTSSVTKAATCTATGVRTYKCSRCTSSYTESIAATGHSYGAWTSTAATCTEKGVSTRTCSKCSNVETNYTDALGHNYITYTVQPTYISKGFSHHLCSRCSAEYKDNYTSNIKSIPSTSFTVTASGKAVTLKIPTTPLIQGYTITRKCNGVVDKETSVTDSAYRSFNISGFNKERGANEIIVYTRYGTYAETNIWGSEIVVDANGYVTGKRAYGSEIKSIVPEGGFVVSMHNPSEAFGNIKIGDKVAYDMESKTLMVYYAGTADESITYIDTTVENGKTYTYTVTPYVKNIKGSSSEKQVTIIPSSVAGFSNTAKTDTSLTLSWNKNTSGTGYVIQMLYGTTWKTIKTISGNATTSCTITGLAPSVTYDFRICAYKTVSGVTYYSAYTDKMSAITLPSVVTNFRNTAKTSTSLTLTWDKNTSGDGYVIQMLYGTTWKSIKTVSGNATTSCTITGLAPSVTYNFRICTFKTAYGRNYYSAFSSSLSAITLPSAVTGFKISAKTDTTLTLAWNKNTSGDGYVIQLLYGNTWKSIKNVSGNATTSCTITGLAPCVTYNFRICTFNTAYGRNYYSVFSNKMSATTNPSAITGFKLGGRAADALRLNWTKNTSADGYIIEQYKSGEWVRIVKITSNATTTYRVTGLAASTQYKFRVKAYKMSGKTALYSGYTGTLSAYTNPSKVANLKITGKATTALRLGWSKNTSADGYIVEMYKDGKWVRAAKITSNATVTYRKAGLAKGTTYKFRVRTYNMVGNTALYGNYVNVSGTTNK